MVPVAVRARPHDSTVEVWVAPLDAPADVLRTLAHSLAPDERARAAGFRSPADGRRFALAHGWLRLVLGAALGVAPADVALAGGPGKPVLVGASGPRFNLSHAGDLAVVAVAPFEVGVDVEPLAGGDRWSAAAAAACAPAEAEAIGRLPAGERAAAFLAAWTAKEAHLKGVGTGLATEPRHVVVGVPDRHRPTPVGRSDGGPGGWFVRRIEPAPGHVGAVAAQGAAWRAVVRPAAGLVSGARAG